MMPSAPVYPYDPEFDDDERLARQLQQEEQDERMARDLEVQIKREEDLRHSSAQQNQDAVVALNLEQQLQDEALARQFALQEEQQAQSQTAAATPVVTPSRSRRFCTTIIPCLVLIAVVTVLYFVLWSDDGEGGGGFEIPGIPFFTDPNPFDGLEPGEVARWRTSGNDGLQLTVVNALDDDWQDVFSLVIQDWDNGTPDVLELSVKTADPDPRCDPITGKSKVCNGNYGNTDWKGINMAIIQLGYIQASSSRVNEYHLQGATTAQRRYTLCHEIGHSFGLPHTDEDFFNRDLGNCMDYTQNPKANQSPDESNFEFLEELYGVLPGQTSSTESAASTSPANRRRSLLRTTNKDLPESVRVAAKDVMATFSDPHNNGRRLQETLELEDGWSIQIHKVLA